MRTAAPQDTREAFLADVVDGLTASPKTLSSRWFYDDEGSRLFEAIMGLPEYYLTACEARALEGHRARIHRAAGGGPLHVADLGAGNGDKTRILLSHLRALGCLLSYVPVDVSVEALRAAEAAVRRELPGTAVRPLEGDWLEALAGWSPDPPGPRLLLFLGANIGNYSRAESAAFLAGLRETLDGDDALLVGFDLRKDPARILRAYDDAAGVTARFNYNLLARINRELGGTFRIGDFRHRAAWDAEAGAARSYLVARRGHEVRIADAGLTIRFREGEAIHTESSFKHSLPEIESLARAAGFRPEAHFHDPTGSFADSLWRPA